ncbi:MAG: MotA/TolQ/ExbB proton channel family protein [Candidatus Omnitrophica bacterium]|nr:MotA/TolQ/ExbB proton channel family protein [Candidatus Omnitrophota bacterium]
MWEFIIKGGPIMGLIILCSIMAFAVFLERMWHLRNAKIDTKKFMQEISAKVKNNKVMEALDMCNITRGPIARILKSGIMKYDRHRHDIKEAIENAGIHEVPLLEKNLGVLATIAHITPLLGLLGTVVGMLKAFQVIEEKAMSMVPVNPGDLAGGIWEALITTVAGLSIAIPTYVAYNYLVSRVDNFVLDMEKSATELVNILSDQRETA